MKIVFFNCRIVGYFNDEYHFFENEIFFQEALNAGIFDEDQRKKVIILNIKNDAFDEIEETNNETEH
jgi:hypothetical protein